MTPFLEVVALLSRMVIETITPVLRINAIIADGT
jgi:hypothetical protein